jgi:hypothetical protein
LQNTKEKLHQNQHLSARTTFIILIVDNREVILGHKVMSGITYTIYQCIPLLIIGNGKVPMKQLCNKIRRMTLQQRHNMGHHRRDHR